MEHRVRCPACRSGYVFRDDGAFVCAVCLEVFEDRLACVDFVADRATPALWRLQESGDVVLVPLPEGFCGVIVVAGEEGVTEGDGRG